jgi:hypothetical protein
VCLILHQLGNFVTTFSDLCTLLYSFDNEIVLTEIFAFIFQLLGNILCWHGLIGTQLLQRLALDGLLNRYVVLGLANSHVDRHAMEKCQAVSSSKQLFYHFKYWLVFK